MPRSRDAAVRRVGGVGVLRPCVRVRQRDRVDVLVVHAAAAVAASALAAAVTAAVASAALAAAALTTALTATRGEAPTGRRQCN